MQRYEVLRAGKFMETEDRTKSEEPGGGRVGGTLRLNMLRDPLEMVLEDG